MNINYFLSVLTVLAVFAAAYFAYSNYSLENEVTSLRASINRLYNKPGVLQENPNITLLNVSQKSMPIVAVSSDGSGVMANVTVRIIPGSNNVLVNTNPFVEPDLQFSVSRSVAVAQAITNYGNMSDFIFTYGGRNLELIGGESAGAATAIIAVAAIENRSLKENAVITGTIELDGTIGKVSGLLEKARAVAERNYSVFIIPSSQARITYYERNITTTQTPFGIEIQRTIYVPHTIDLKDFARNQWNLTVVEVSNINQALPYFI